MNQTHHDPASALPSPQGDSAAVSAANALFAQLRDGVVVLRLDQDTAETVDFVVLQANPAFGHQTGLDARPGQRLGELLPGLAATDPELFDRFLRVARGGRGEAFEGLVVALRGAFSGQLICPQPGRLIATFARLPDHHQAAQQHEHLLAEQRAILDSNLVGLVRTRERRITWANAAAEALFGYPLVELLGQTTERLYTSKVAFERFAEVALPVIRAGQVFRGESQVRRKDGSLRWFSHQATQLAPGSDDHVSSFIDITDRVEAQEALLRSEARLRSTFAALGDGVVLQGIDGAVVDANPAAEQILGLTRDQLLGRTSLDPHCLVVREDGRPWPCEDLPAAVALRTGVPQREQVMGVSAPHIGLRWISVNANPVHYPGQPRPEGVVATFSDITERRCIEAQLAATLDELRDLYDNAPCGYHSLDAEGRVRHINTTELAWLGRTREEVIGQPLARFIGLQGHALFERHFPSLLEGGSVSGVEFDLVGTDGSVRRVAVTGTAVKDARGRFLRSRTILHDITPMRHAEQIRLEAVRLEAENAQMRETNRLKGLFIANMSHELKTPLNAVLGAVQMHELGLIKPGTSRFNRFIAQIGSSGRHLSRLIDDILDHASLEAGRLAFRPQPVDPAQVMQRVVDMARPEIDQKRLTLAVTVDPTLGTLFLDPLRLQQVANNFLSNAIKFTADGGQVAVRVTSEGPEQFRIEVEDTGIGIAAADLPGLFVEFHQVSSGRTKEYRGTGLGLALTRRLVEHQGGGVGVRSVPGVGSVFHAILPRSARPDAAPSAPP